MSNQASTRPYIVEYCHPRSIQGRCLQVQKIRRTQESDPIPDAISVLSKFLPNTVAVLYKSELWYVSIGKKTIYLHNTNKTKKIVIASICKNSDGQQIVNRIFSIASEIKGIFTAPIYPWGQIFDLMFMYLGTHSATNIQFIPDDIYQSFIRHQINLTKKLLQDGEPVYWGSTNSILLMSVPWPHLHISRTQTNLSIGQIDKYRSVVNWDWGLSRHLGDVAKRKLTSLLMPLNFKHTISSDNVGLSISLPEFRTDWLLDPTFDQFHKLVHNTIDEIMAMVHQSIYESDISTIYSYVNQVKAKKDYFNPSKLNDFFMPKTIGIASSNRLHKLLLQLDQKNCQIRRPGGWASLMRIEPDGGAVLYIMFTYIHEPVGPFEGIGIKFKEAQDNHTVLLNEQQIFDYFQP